MISKENFHSEPDNNDGFSILLEGYEGPIDLLLELAKKPLLTNCLDEQSFSMRLNEILRYSECLHL